MSLSIEEKKAVVEQVSGMLSASQVAIVAEYRGLDVASMTDLRRRAREAGVQLQIVKNTLARRAVKDTNFECLDEYLIGPLALAASEDAVTIAKVLADFAKDHDRLAIKVGAMSGEVLSASAIQELAKLPGRAELLAMLVGTIQAPIRKFVQTVHEVPARFVRTVAAVRDAKGAA